MKKKFLLSFIISLIAFSLMFMGLGKTLLANNDYSPSTGESDSEIDLGLEPRDEVKQKVKNEIVFLMMGVDAKDVKKSKGTRTDTMMLTKVNFDTGAINLLSIPRDTRVLIKGKEDKINHAHAFGGPDLTMKTLQDFLKLDVDYYVKLDYRAVKGIVDAIGGVEIDVPMDMRYKDPTADPPLNINIKKGLQTLDGNNAHDFLRFRSGYPEGDLGRVKAQQYFLKELVKQTVKPKNLFKLPKLVETYFDYVDTNIPMSVILKGATAAKKIDVENMTTNTIPGYDKRIGGIDYLIYNRDETRIIIQEMFGDYLQSQ